MTFWILNIRISLGSKFQLKLATLIFQTKFAQKGYFRSKTEKVNITIEFYIFDLVQVSNFSFNWQFWFLEPNLPQKGISGRKQKNWTLPFNSHIRVSLGTKFHVKLLILIFWTKFTWKGYFRSKTEKVSATIGFSIFEFVQVLNFSLNWKLSFFGPK